jgi:serine phosphatase RsbU (regulator of sigma subunit)/catechol 2,3-dioxygenase-like lactoylglutathione lyase family enzyme
MKTSPLQPNPPQLASHLRIHAVQVFVRDQEQSLRFYVDKLGFEVAFDALLQSGERWIAVTPPDGSAVLTLVAPKPASFEYPCIGRPTGVVLVTDDVTSKYKEWRKRGVRFLHTPRLRRVKYERQRQEEMSPCEDTATVWGGVFTAFRDEDGNSFELVGFDEVSREIELQRQASAAKLESERRAAQELEIATTVQARLFPQQRPLTKTLEYAGICFQARQVGGDYYDFLALDEQRFGLVIGDIAGKGMAAALLMANLQASLRSQCAIASLELERLLQSVNRMFFESTAEGAYATLFFAQYCDQTQILRYVNCGHLPGLLLRKDNSVEKLDSTATVLGLFKEWDCSVGECRIYPGDTLALYTDGITESFNDSEEDFGENRLIQALRRHRGLSSQQLVDSILAEVQQFSAAEQHDDITLIVAKCGGDSPISP